LPVGPETVDLDKGACQLFRFPGRGRFAGSQPHGDILDAHRLAGPQCQVADDSVTLVEQAQHGDALSHRRYSRLLCRRTRNVERDRLVLGSLVATVAAAYDHQQGDRKEAGYAGHAYSGFHAS
jgi:hypothetical protein